MLLKRLICIVLFYSNQRGIEIPKIHRQNNYMLSTTCSAFLSCTVSGAFPSNTLSVEVHDLLPYSTFYVRRCHYAKLIMSNIDLLTSKNRCIVFIRSSLRVALLKLFLTKRQLFLCICIRFITHNSHTH